MKKLTEYFGTTVETEMKYNNKKQLNNNTSQTTLRLTNTIQNHKTNKNNAFKNSEEVTNQL